MRAVQKLIRNGNSTQITIPRPILIHLGWLPGQTIILELLEDKSVRVRLPLVDDFTMKRSTVVTVADVPAVRA